MSAFLKNNLKFLRKKFKYTQSDISSKLNISRSTFSNYEQGQSEPDIETIINICKIFNCSIDDFLTVDLSIEDSFQNITVDNCNNVFSDKLYNQTSYYEDLESIKNKYLEDLKKLDSDYKNYRNFLNSKIASISKTIDNIKINNSDITTLEVASKITPININNCVKTHEKTEIAEETSPVISLDEYKSSKNSIDVDFYNENNVFIVDASPFSSDETEKVYSYGNVSAGIPTFGEDSIEDEFNIFKYDLKYDSDHYFVLKVKGESMNKLYKNGDYLLVEKSCNYDPNKPVIVFLEDEVTVKFVEITNNYITIIPYSTEPQFEPIHYSLKNYNYYIAGTVVGVINIIKDN